MITACEVYTPGVTVAPLSLADGTEANDLIQILNIDGIGPVEAAVNTSAYGLIDGEAYNGSSIGKRNIVLTLGLNPDWSSQTYESLRQILYSYFMPKNKVRLRFDSTHLPQVEIIGYVETFTPTIFGQDQVVQVSIICPQPAFIATTATVITGTTLSLSDGTPVTIDYRGTLPTGFLLTVTDNASSADLNGEVRLLNTKSTTELMIISGAVVTATQSLQISTVQGSKFVRQAPLPSGVAVNALGKVSPGSIWVSLEYGANKFRVLSAVAGEDWSMQYFSRFGGL